MIRIFTSAYDCGNEDKKENFRMKMVKKAWFSQ